MKWLWLFVAGCGGSSSSGTPVPVVELADRGRGAVGVAVTREGLAFGFAGDRLVRAVDGVWIDDPNFDVFELPTGIDYRRDGRLLLSTVFFSSPNTSALWSSARAVSRSSYN